MGETSGRLNIEQAMIVNTNWIGWKNEFKRGTCWVVDGASNLLFLFTDLLLIKWITWVNLIELANNGTTCFFSLNINICPFVAMMPPFFTLASSLIYLILSKLSIYIIGDELSRVISALNKGKSEKNKLFFFKYVLFKRRSNYFLLDSSNFQFCWC